MKTSDATRVRIDRAGEQTRRDCIVRAVMMLMSPCDIEPLVPHDNSRLPLASLPEQELVISMTWREATQMEGGLGP